MSTFMQRKEDVTRKWYILDAAGKPLGKTAVTAAVLLRGKHKPTYTPHVDCGDFVIVINAEKAVLTGNKADQKMYYSHSGYVGNLKEKKFSDLIKKHPEQVMSIAVKGMLGKNSQGKEQLTRLRVCRGADHKHAAQKPEPWTE